jgi:chromate reductase
MITVISATNRPSSFSRRVATIAHQLFVEKGATDTQFFSLEDLPADMFHPSMYDGTAQSAGLAELQNKFLIPSNKFYIVAPEYNGSYPGVFKMLLDACSVRAAAETFGGGKKAGLLGIAAGRAGNLRGIEQLASVLNYFKITVMPNLQPIATIGNFFDKDGNLTDDSTRKIIDAHVSQFLQF